MPSALTRSALLLALLAGMVAAAHSRPPAPPPAATSPAGPIRGVWRNSYNSVDVRIDDCGGQVCGVVVGATAEALADAKDSGYPNLIGMQLLRDYRAVSPTYWSGTVFVPDLGHSFSSHIVLLDPGHFRIAGCLWRQFLCKSQIWRRL